VYNEDTTNNKATFSLDKYTAINIQGEIETNKLATDSLDTHIPGTDAISGIASTPFIKLICQSGKLRVVQNTRREKHSPSLFQLEPSLRDHFDIASYSLDFGYTHLHVQMVWRNPSLHLLHHVRQTTVADTSLLLPPLSQSQHLLPLEQVQPKVIMVELQCDSLVDILIVENKHELS
jgi:hypothetical protein